MQGSDHHVKNLKTTLHPCDLLESARSIPNPNSTNSALPRHRLIHRIAGHQGVFLSWLQMTGCIPRTIHWTVLWIEPHFHRPTSHTLLFFWTYPFSGDDQIATMHSHRVPYSTSFQPFTYNALSLLPHKLGGITCRVSVGIWSRLQRWSA